MKLEECHERNCQECEKIQKTVVIGRHLVTECMGIKCPYCGMLFSAFSFKHVSSCHLKTLDDWRREFPDAPTMTVHHINQMMKEVFELEGTLVLEDPL